MKERKIHVFHVKKEDMWKSMKYSNVASTRRRWYRNIETRRKMIRFRLKEIWSMESCRKLVDSRKICKKLKYLEWFQTFLYFSRNIKFVLLGFFKNIYGNKSLALDVLIFLQHYDNILFKILIISCKLIIPKIINST